MKESLGIVAGLKRAVKAKGMTYKDLARALHMSEAGVKRAFAKGSFTLTRLDEICAIVGTTVFDLVHATGRLADASLSLTDAQEAALARDDALFAFYSLLLAGLTPARIAAKFVFSPADCEAMLGMLERLDLVERRPRGRIVLRKAEDFLWATGGPLARRHWPGLAHEFVGGDFRDGPHRHFAFAAGALTPTSLAVLRKKLEELVADFDKMVAMDAGDRREKRVRVWLMNAYRPFVYSVVARYGRRPAGGLATGGPDGAGPRAPARRP